MIRWRPSPIKISDLVTTYIGGHDRNCFGNPAKVGPITHYDYCDVIIHFELEKEENKYLPNHSADAKLMKKVEKDGNLVFYSSVTENIPEYGRLCILPTDHAEFGVPEPSCRI